MGKNLNIEWTKDNVQRITSKPSHGKTMYLLGLTTMYKSWGKIVVWINGPEAAAGQCIIIPALTSFDMVEALEACRHADLVVCDDIDRITTPIDYPASHVVDVFENFKIPPGQERIYSMTLRNLADLHQF